MNQRPCKIAGTPQRGAQIVVRESEVRFCGDGLAKAIDRLGQMLLPQTQQAKALMKFRNVRPEFDRLLHVAARRRYLSLACQDCPPEKMRLAVRGVLHEEIAICAYRFIDASGLLQLPGTLE